ncbi:tumor suppressor candidate 3 isoform X2 [Frieseomelitta varia]|uniref:tumor suppressor candidate 3 isoform X2 n=1 Tax=Frieseomelitta varia TaxID=561572 RepID=UPI001CB687A5|nr:tumor suppressor candidate 3 isoform X2 [Frieseomelitta varia]
MECKKCIILLGLVLSLNYVYGQYRMKNTPGSSLSDRVQQLSELALTRPVIKFNGAKFKEYVKTTPRNYSVVVMFTAMAPQRQCQICRHANDEFVIVANSFRYLQSHSKKLFFASVDFDEGSDVFHMMRLNTAPVYMHFPPKGKPKPADTMDIQRVGFGAEAIAKWISERTDIQIRVFRPPNYSGTVAIIMLLILIGGFLYLRRNNLDFIYNKTIWGLGALVMFHDFFTLTMISGQMWNHIRGPPFIHRSPSGNVAYIHASSQGQFILETYIVMILNGAVVLGMILMTEAASRKGDVKKRRIFAAIGAGLVAIFFSSLLSIFRNKVQGYPYRED